jgi:hypothetical protein
VKWYHEQYFKVNSRVTSEIHQFSKYDSRMADKCIYHCTKCNSCWETSWLSSTKTTTVYKDFPTYKRKKKQCPMCNVRSEK